jgi:phosphoglycerol transferase MdoB-like AlkP superfamily enzyme
MGKTTEHIERFFVEAGEYIETKTELWKLKLADRISDAISGTVMIVMLAVIGFLFVLLISVGISLWLGELTGKTYYGFFIVGAFYALLALIFYIFRQRWLKVPVANRILRKFFK